MKRELVLKAFDEGVKAALGFFKGGGGKKGAAEAAETVRKNMVKAVRAASKKRR